MAKIEFDSKRFEGQWAELIDFGDMSQEQLEELQGTSTGEEGARAFLSAVVREWHVFNPKTGEPLPTPGSTGWTTKQVPLSVLRRISAAIGEEIAGLTPKD